MKKFSVIVELEISEADLAVLHEDNEGWSIENEVTSWLSDLGFKVNDVRTYEGDE
jgi:hypothetical protein